MRLHMLLLRLLLAILLAALFVATEPLRQRADVVVQVEAMQTNETREVQALPRGAHKKKDEGGLMSMVQKFAPLLTIPMTLQALTVPFQLGAVYLMLVYSVLIGKIAVTLMVANQIKQNALNAEYHKPLIHQHYGYDGSEEYGAWIN